MGVVVASTWQIVLDEVLVSCFFFSSSSRRTLHHFRIDLIHYNDVVSGIWLKQWSSDEIHWDHVLLEWQKLLEIFSSGKGFSTKCKDILQGCSSGNSFSIGKVLPYTKFWLGSMKCDKVTDQTKHLSILNCLKFTVYWLFIFIFFYGQINFLIQRIHL